MLLFLPCRHPAGSRGREAAPCQHTPGLPAAWPSPAHPAQVSSRHQNPDPKPLNPTSFGSVPSCPSWASTPAAQLPQHPSSCCLQSPPMRTPNHAGRAGAYTSCSNPPRFPWRLNTESLPGRLETRGGGMWCLCGPGGNKGSLHSRAQPSPSWPGHAPSPPPSCCPLLFPASSPDKPSVLPKAPNRLAAARSSSPPSHHAQAEG